MQKVNTDTKIERIAITNLRRFSLLSTNILEALASTSQDAWVFGAYKSKFSGHDRHNMPANLSGLLKFHPLCRTDRKYNGAIKELLMRNGGIPLFIHEVNQRNDFGGLWNSQSRFFVWHGKGCLFPVTDIYFSSF